jgi:hypothetical protein
VVSAVGGNRVDAGALAGFGGSTVSVTPADMATGGEGGSIDMTGAEGELLLLPGSEGVPGRDGTVDDTPGDALAETLVLLTVVAGSFELPLPQPASNVTPAKAIPIAIIFI